MNRLFCGVVVVCLLAMHARAQQPTDVPSTCSPTSANGSPNTPVNGPTAGAPAVAAGSCASGCADTRLSNLCSPGRVWAEAEMLLWFPRGDSLPPLVTTSPVGTPRATAGVLGQPGTAVLFGNQTVNDDLAPGFRGRAGMWFDYRQSWGIEGSFFFLGNDNDNFQANSTQFPVLDRPFFNTQLPGQDSQIVALPGVSSGAVAVEAQRSNFYGFDLNSRCNLRCACNYRLDFLAGYRFLGLTDELIVGEALTAINPANPAPVGSTIALQDRFRTINSFHGGQIGLAGEYRLSRFVLGFRGLAALGNVHRTANIQGATVISVPGQDPVSNPSGLLALPSNTGRFSSDRLGFASEVGLNLGYQITDHFRMTVGYSFLCLTDVLRPGDQIDLAVNASQLFPALPQTGPRRPAFTPNSTDFWAQGINFGLVARY